MVEIRFFRRLRPEILRKIGSWSMLAPLQLVMAQMRLVFRLPKDAFFLFSKSFKRK